MEGLGLGTLLLLSERSVACGVPDQEVETSQGKLVSSIFFVGSIIIFMTCKSRMSNARLAVFAKKENRVGNSTYFFHGHFGRVVKATDLNSAIPGIIFDICFMRERRFEPCRCRSIKFFPLNFLVRLLELVRSIGRISQMLRN